MSGHEASSLTVHVRLTTQADISSFVITGGIGLSVKNKESRKTSNLREELRSKGFSPKRHRQ